MADTQTLSALKRMADTGRAATADAPTSPLRILRKVLAQTSQDLNGLVLSVTAAQELRFDLSKLVDDLPEGALFCLLAGPGDSMGLAVFDDQVIAALIEHQTTGRVVPKPAQPRPPTATDAMMVSELLDLVLAQFAAAAGPPNDTVFTYRMTLDEPRTVSMTLEECDYRAFQLTLDLGRGAKTGKLLLVFPILVGTVSSGQGEWSAKLEKTVFSAQVTIEAMLHRFPIRLAEVSEWAPGTLLPIPASALEKVVLQGSDGVRVGMAKLGQSHGHRAVRLLASGTEPNNVDTAAPTAPAKLPDPMVKIAAAPIADNIPLVT